MKVPDLRWNQGKPWRPIPERGEYKGREKFVTIVVPKNHRPFLFFIMENVREAQDLRDRNINGIMSRLDLQQQLQIAGSLS
jgi:hypothetical protein